jgi:hypothetical protein
MPIYFCDKLDGVSIVNGVARLEFQRLVAQSGGDNRELRATAEFTVAIPTQGLAQMINVLEAVRDRLVRDGILKAAGVEGSNAGMAAPSGDRSPNF